MQIINFFSRIQYSIKAWFFFSTFIFSLQRSLFWERIIKKNEHYRKSFESYSAVISFWIVEREWLILSVLMRLSRQFFSKYCIVVGPWYVCWYSNQSVNSKLLEIAFKDPLIYLDRYIDMYVHVKLTKAWKNIRSILVFDEDILSIKNYYCVVLFL